MNVKRILSILCLSGALCLLCGCDFMDYQKAKSLLSQGNFEEARAIYTQMEKNGGYKDSAQMLEECDYVEAGAAYEEGNYTRAIKMYEALESYGDAPEQLKKAQYSYALQCKEDGDLGGAYALFTELGDYEDCAAMAQECVARSLENPQVGDAVFFGSFEQDKDEGNGPEPIQWRVLAREGDDLLLMSERLLCRMAYHEADQWQEFDDPAEFDGEFNQNTFPGGDNEWQGCDLRTWLNGEFYETAFSGEEKGCIQKTVTFLDQYREYNLDNLWQVLTYYYREKGFDGDELRQKVQEHMDQLMEEYDNAGDHVFLLSANEVRGLLDRGKERVASLTQAAGSGTSTWWTRSHTKSGTHPVVVTVEDDGEVDTLSPSQDAGVRPVICLSLSGKPSDEALNLELFGYDSNTDLYDTATESSGGSSGPCPACNGTGTIRFYYGSSDLEAILSGHDPYTLGTCPMCNGRG